MLDIVFGISALVSVVSAMLIVTRRNPVYSVLFMLPFFLALTILFVMLQAPFLAAIQMIVYGGAILVVFLFVIMLINQRPEELREDFSWPVFLSASVLTGMLGGALALFVSRGASAEMEAAFQKDVPPVLAAAPAVKDALEKGGHAQIVFGSVESLAAPLFKTELVPFELASILIVVAILGAVLLAKKKV